MGPNVDEIADSGQQEEQQEEETGDSLANVRAPNPLFYDAPSLALFSVIRIKLVIRERHPPPPSALVPRHGNCDSCVMAGREESN